MYGLGGAIRDTQAGKMLCDGRTRAAVVKIERLTQKLDPKCSAVREPWIVQHAPASTKKRGHHGRKRVLQLVPPARADERLPKIRYESVHGVRAAGNLELVDAPEHSVGRAVISVCNEDHPEAKMNRSN